MSPSEGLERFPEYVRSVFSFEFNNYLAFIYVLSMYPFALPFFYFAYSRARLPRVIRSGWPWSKPDRVDVCSCGHACHLESDCDVCDENLPQHCVKCKSASHCHRPAVDTLKNPCVDCACYWCKWYAVCGCPSCKCEVCFNRTRLDTYTSLYKFTLLASLAQAVLNSATYLTIRTFDQKVAEWEILWYIFVFPWLSYILFMSWVRNRHGIVGFDDPTISALIWVFITVLTTFFLTGLFQSLSLPFYWAVVLYVVTCISVLLSIQ
ncbi:hypothetical protein RCL1_006995 [Eukaryota sp. TZLM3-RCL]